MTGVGTMPDLTVTTDDGVALHVQVTGSGTDVLFLHEFSGDYRSWEDQVRALSRRYRCITFSARGFPGSDVPPDVESYSQARAVQDARSEEHTSELQSLMRSSYAVFCLKKKK